MINSNQNNELIARINDIFDIVQQKNHAKFTSFLDESKVYFAKSFIEKRKYDNYMFFGGCHNNKRKMLGVFPDYLNPDKQLFPIASLIIEFPSRYSLSHRDFLGAIMGLNVTKDSIGDLIVSDQSCSAFLRGSVVSVVERELTKVGSVGVKVSRAFLSEIIIQDKFKEITGTVSSFRLDSIVSFVCNVSRDKSTVLINNGMVSVNYQTIQTNHFTMKSSNILSIRGYGKYILTNEVYKTKKGRYFINVKQFV